MPTLVGDSYDSVYICIGYEYIKHVLLFTWNSGFAFCAFAQRGIFMYNNGKVVYGNVGNNDQEWEFGLYAYKDKYNIGYFARIQF